MAKKRRMTCMGCGRTLRGRKCPVHGKSGMAATKAVKTTLAANAAVAKAAGGSLLTKSAGSRPQTAEDLRRERLKRDLYHPDPQWREGAWRQMHPDIYGPGGSAS